MPQFEPAQFLRDAQKIKTFHPLALFVGDEETLISQCLKSYRSAFLARYGNDIPDFNIETLQAEKESAHNIIEACSTLPLGTEKRLVIVNHTERLSENSLSLLAQYCDSPNPSTSLVLLWHAKLSPKILNRELTTKISRNGLLVTCAKLYEGRRTEWVKEQMRQSGRQMSDDAAQLLSREGGESLRELKTEIDKLLLFVEDKKEIGIRDVQETLSFKPNRSVWDMTRNLELGRVQKAGQILEHCLEQGEEPIRILNSIVWNYRKPLSASNKLSEAQLKKYRTLFSEFKKSDLLLKSGQGIESAVLEKLLNLCSGQACNF